MDSIKVTFRFPAKIHDQRGRKCHGNSAFNPGIIERNFEPSQEYKGKPGCPGSSAKTARENQVHYLHKSTLIK